MPASKAHLRATAKWAKENYSQMAVLLPKGRKDVIKEYAASNNESMNALIIRLIKQEIGSIEPEENLQEHDNDTIVSEGVTNQK
jgi:hypothetical protein